MTFVRRRAQSPESGNILILFAFTLVILILFIGLSVDFGLAYVTKANLSKSVDAAALAGAKNLYQGQGAAEEIARSAFAMNYGKDSRDYAAPVVNVNFSTDGAGTRLINVTATSTIRTYFIALLPQWRTLSVASAAQAVRAKAMVSLVLDRSGSMYSTTGGAQYLPDAVTTFVSYFDDAFDYVSASSFAGNSTVDVAMQSPFKDNIDRLMQKWKSDEKGTFQGATFATGGMQNGLAENQRIAVSGGNVFKAVVFFTDGFANVVNDQLYIDTNTKWTNTNRPAVSAWNFGGYDPKSSGQVALIDPQSGDTACSEVKSKCGTAGPPTLFPNGNGKGKKPLTKADVKSEAESRTIQVADTMRANGMVVYSIGLGNSKNLNVDFLKQVANDPTSSSYDPNSPAGETVITEDPKDLEKVFAEIASKILLRLTR